MAKSRGRKFAEITTPTNGVFDIASVPTITNAKLQNSAMTLAGSSVSLGGTGVADTDALSEGSSNLYFTNARVQSFLGGGTLAGNVVVPDNRSIYLGSDSDFRMVHNTNNTQLINATGQLQITSNGGFAVTGAATFSSTGAFSGASLTVGSSSEVNIVASGHSLFPSIKVNNNGYIGSASATSAIQILTSGDVTFAGTISSGAIQSTSEIRNIGTSGSASNRLKLAYDSTNGTALIGPDSNGGSTTLALGTSNSGTYANALTIGSTGIVTFAGGIVTSAPSTFSGSSTDYAIIVSSSDAYTGIRFTDPDRSGNLYYRGATNHMYLHDSSFAVAGQTIASGYKFQVNGDSNFVGDIAVLSDSKKIFLGASSDLQVYHDGSNNVINSANSHSLRIAVGGTNQWEFHPSSIFKGNDGKKIILGDSSDLQLYHDGNNSYMKNSTAALILDSGNVNVVSGVTNTQTTWPLHVSYSNNSGAHGGIQVSNYNTGTTSNWAGLSAHAVNGGVQAFYYAADYDNWGVGAFAGTATSHPFHLFSNNTERMRITAAGNVGIGISAPTARLTVSGQITGGFGAATTAGTTNWNDSTNARSGMGYTLLTGNASNGPGGGIYYYPVCYEYISKDGTGNMTQLAIPYNGSQQYIRYRYSGSWSSWSAV